ncbi:MULTISPECIES: helix-turn-helix transcriptional regulator [unclassified Streptomyces]|nr:MULTISPECIES: helix-turn-helix transcriptional regulator [unclassified Streptomyces]MYY83555.1 helix-turn-helix domain-containing protein [Streptomyces sp. SID335]MYZ12682.1 helix-turn-helix domain-containing protein [Streptomyces sp. SID337]NEB43985.1 helix-turn-helix transcriptional regulator [Streptomyces sp. SID339]
MSVGMSRAADPVDPGWAEFGRLLRFHRRRAGLTQLQLGRRVGYHHSFISRLEGGLREPPFDLVNRLDAVLVTGGRLAALVALPPPSSRYAPGPLPVAPTLFSPIPGTDTSGETAYPAALPWPVRLPAEGLACPLHGRVGCATPDREAVTDLLAGLTGPYDRVGVTVGAEAELLHGLTAVLACLIREASGRATDAGASTVERLLRGVVRWADAVNAGGRLPYGQLRLAAQYAQVAGRLRMERGQGGVAMAWFGHGLRWADAAQDAEARATLLCDMSTLVRLDGDPASTLVYAQAIGAVDVRRRWMTTLADLYQARAYALGHDVASCRRHLAMARRRFARLDDRDRLEAPWLSGAEGVLRVESAAGGALRDLSVVTGGRAVARRAVEATARSYALLAPTMRSTRLLLTLRLADSWACAGDPVAAVTLAGPVLEEVVGARDLTVAVELRGLHRRLAGRWGDLAEVREYRERVRAVSE